MKIYYAHPMSWYGIDRERDDIGAIDRNTPLQTEIINPNSPEFKEQVDRLIVEADNAGQPYPGSAIMKIFIDTVASCDAIAYRTFDDDYIGAGVAQELLTAAIHGKQIFRILDLTRDKGPMLFEQQGLRAAFGPRVLTITDTRDRIRRGVQ